MKQRFLSAFLRFFAYSALILMMCLGWASSAVAAGPPVQSPANGPKIWLQDSQSLPINHLGPANVVGPLVSGQAQPLSMTSADVDQDGVADLLVGYSAPGGGTIVVHRGNLDAFAPQSDASFQAIGRGQFPSPFLPDAQTFPVPVSPDFLATGDFTGQGHTDLVVASRGGSTLYIFSGDGKGNFTPGPTISLPAGVTSLGVGFLGKSQPFSDLIVGVSGPKQTFLAVYAGGPQGLAPLSAFPLKAPATSINFGDFGDIGLDAAFLSGGQVVLLHSSSMQLETLSLPVNAVALALGSFVSDRVPGLQIALLDSNGSIQIAAHNEFDPRAFTLDELKSIRAARLQHQPTPLVPQRSVAKNGWKIVESIPSVTSYSAGQPPLLFRTRISANGGDDVMVLNGSTGQMAVVSHPDVQPGAPTFLPAQVSTRPYSGSPTAAIPARVNIDARPGVLAVHQGETGPRVMMPLPDPTFFVNRFDDPVPGAIASTCNNLSNADVSSSCSLREAVRKANNTLGLDTIMLVAGTYTLSQPRAATPLYDAATGTLDVTDSVNIVGAGQATTIIQGGTVGVPGTPNGVDKVFSFNQDITAFTNATVSVTNLTIENGFNRGNTTLTDGWGGAFDFDTGGTTAGTGNATLTLTNVTITNNTLTDGEGGGFAIFNTNTGIGNATLSNCIIQNNVVKPTVVVGNGGGIFISDTAILTMSNSQVLNNQANTGIAAPVGGGIELLGNHTGSSLTIHNSTISGNHAGGQGGGIFSNANLTIDQSSIISNNTAGTQGGGLFQDAAVGDSASLSKVTITGNTSTANGGGIHVGNTSTVNTVAIHFSRLAGNTAPGGTANLDNVKGTINGTDNWWGTNSPATTLVDSSGGVTTFDPFIELTHTASPNKIRINTPSTLTADMSKDNHGVGTALAGNLDVIVGLPVTFHNAVLGTILETQPETLGNPVPTATATYNAGGVGGNGSADATVDQATVTASIIVLQPPSITKSFSPTTVAVNAPSTITFNIVNGNTVAINASFTDTLPANLVVATTPSVASTCGGTVTATAGAGSISFSNPALAVDTPTLSTPCSITVNVQGTTDGVFHNTVTIDSTDAGNGNTAATNPDLTVINAPSINKQFGALTIFIGQSTSLTFTINNTNANTTLNGIAFTDTLPAGLVVATPSGLNSTCGGTATATAGSSSVSLTGASLAPGASCTVSVNITGTTAGVKNNSVQVTATNAGGLTGITSNASITVNTPNPPTITKGFGAATIPLNGTTSLTFNITNPNTGVTLTGIAFTDNLPAGLVVATTPNLNSTCGGTATAVGGSGSVSLSGGTLAASASCTVSVNITGSTPGVKNNSVQVTSTEGGTGNTSNATITVLAPPVIIKAFGAASIPLNGTTSLSFTIQNNNATTTLNGIGFSDTLPAGLIISTPNGLTGSCGGGTITATQATGVISLSGATLAASGSCTFSVNVTGTAAGQQNNTTGNVTSTEGGTGGTASASIAVVAPPSIAKVFNPNVIAPNGTSALTFTITNPAANTVAEAGVAFSDTLPAGIVVATPNGLASTCGGTATATAGSGSISLTGGTVAAGSTCTVTVNVTGAAPGTYNNTSGAVSSTNGGTGNTASASLAIKNASLSITKTHQGTLHRGQNGANYTITVSDSASAGPTVGTVTVVDTLPNIQNTLVPTALTGTGWTCTLGTLTCTRSDVLTPGASYPAITLTVNIPQNIQNNFTNTATVSGGGDPNSHTASDPVSLGPPIVITSTDSGAATVKAGAPAMFNFMVDASAINPPATVVAFTCSGLPAGTACIFTPLAEAQIIQTPMTMMVTTLGHTSATAPPFGKGGPPIYAALLFPVLGLVGVSLRGRRGKKVRLRMAPAFAGLVLLLALAGCGGNAQGFATVTRAGTYTVTVTGTASTAQGTAQGSTTVTLTVQ